MITTKKHPRSFRRIHILFCVTLIIFFFQLCNNKYINSTVEESKSSRLSKSSNTPFDCPCFEENNGEVHEFCYHAPADHTVYGRHFNCSHLKYLKKLEIIGYDRNNLIDLKKNASIDPVFITYFSLNHAKEGYQLIKSINKHFPKKKVILYDLGLEYIKPIFTNSCNVEIRDLDLAQYPSGVRKLEHFRWKPIIISEALKEFGAIWLLDASVRLRKSDLSHVQELIACRFFTEPSSIIDSIDERDKKELQFERDKSEWNLTLWARNLEKCQKSAYLLNSYSTHGIFAATHPGVYEFFPTHLEEIKKPKAKMFEAGLALIYRTQEVVDNILKWFLLCALEEGCMNPPHADTFCHFKPDRFQYYAYCHRFDQAVVNLILANQNHYDHQFYTSQIKDFFKIVRQGEPIYGPLICPSNLSKEKN